MLRCPSNRGNSTNGYVTVPYSSTFDTQRPTVEVWVNTANFAANQGLLEKTVGGAINTQYSLFIWSGMLYWRLMAGSNYNDVIYALPTSLQNTWVHIVGTYDGTTQQLYVNGVAVANATRSITLNTGNGPIYLATLAPGYRLAGVLDEVAVYPNALTQTRVQAHYQAASQTTPGTLTTTYTHGYDVEGRQVTVTVGSTTTRFLYDGDGALVAKQVGGVTTTHYVAGGLVEQDFTTNTTKYLYRFGGKLVATRDVAFTGGGTGTLHYLHQDHLGTASLQTTATGTLESWEFRGPFGQPWKSGGPTTLDTDLKYTGQRSFESSLGSLFFYGSRWYSPVVGRFLQPDTVVPDLGRPQDLNRYTYVSNNPLRSIDPTGHTASQANGPVNGVTKEIREKPDGSVWAGEWVWQESWGGWSFIDGEMIAGATNGNEGGGDDIGERVVQIASWMRSKNDQQLKDYFRTVDQNCDGSGGLQNMRCLPFGAQTQGEILWQPQPDGPMFVATVVFTMGKGPNSGGGGNKGDDGSEQAPATGRRASWRAGVREAAIEADARQCVYGPFRCGGNKATTADHIVPYNQEKGVATTRADEIRIFNNPDNLAGACKSCNSSKSDTSLLIWLARTIQKK